MTAKITIEMDNAAFGDSDEPCHGPELARILEQLAHNIGGEADLEGYTMVLRDINGNRVGTFSVK